MEDRALTQALRAEWGQSRRSKPKRSAAYWRRHREQKCLCSGYWFPHRKTGGACEHSTTASYHLARCAGLTHEEALETLSVAGLRKLLPLLDD